MKGIKISMLSMCMLGSVVMNAQTSDEPQFTESIVTDRPDQTEAPALTPKGWFQVELGAQTEFDKMNDIEVQSSLYPTVLWKYGLSKRFELRLITEYGADKATFMGTSSAINGLSPWAVGSKIAICEEKGLIPQISLISHIELPWIGSDNYRPVNIIPRYRFLFSHGLSERVNFSYNLGQEWEDGSSFSTTIYTASVAIALHDRVGFFAEAYGFVREQSLPDHRVDGGFTFLVNNNNQIDISGGVGLSEISPDYFISCGYSFRFNAFDKARKKSSAAPSAQ